MTTLVAKENVYENCNVNKNIIVNEKSSGIKDVIVINVCLNCNNNIIELSCCTCNQKVPCKLKETVFKISIKQKQRLLTYLVPYWSEVSILIMSFLFCHFSVSTVCIREIREVSAKSLNGNFDVGGKPGARNLYVFSIAEITKN